MTDQELLQAIRAITKEELKPIKQEIAEMKKDITEIKDDIAELKENQEETRNGVNMLVNWSEKVSMAATFPLPDIDD